MNTKIPGVAYAPAAQAIRNSSLNWLELTRRGQLVFAQPPFQPIYFTANFGLAQVGRRLETRTR